MQQDLPANSCCLGPPGRFCFIPMPLLHLVLFSAYSNARLEVLRMWQAIKKIIFSSLLSAAYSLWCLLERNFTNFCQWHLHRLNDLWAQRQPRQLLCSPGAVQLLAARQNYLVENKDFLSILINTLPKLQLNDHLSTSFSISLGLQCPLICV